MKHLFEVWPKVTAMLASAEHVLLLSDYDGTLAPIVEDPKNAEAPPETLYSLAGLARETERYTVGLVSGRSLDDLKKRAPLKGLFFAGNHGLEIEGAGVRFIHPVHEETLSVIETLYWVLKRQFNGTGGVIVENKGLTLSVHYRMVENAVGKGIKKIMERVLAVPLASGWVKIAEGKKIYEVWPNVNWGKGSAVKWILSEYCWRRFGERTMPIFLGDDVTDEDAFRTVKKLRGLTVRIGKAFERSAAEFYMRSVWEVEEFLSRLVTLEQEMSRELKAASGE